jgi:protein-histidine pros-kinase
LNLEVSVPSDKVSLTTDRRALNQILLNLANNAVKFTEQGKVSLNLHQQQENGHIRTLFSISDTGPGIRPEDRPRLFEAFTQLDSTSKRRFEGTGLGLHLSQKLAAHLGGTIRVESEFGKGTTFTLDVVQGVNDM